ncbi:MAG: outer membrane beta-barrel protein [Paludibacteraceae bacterium]|nr:outer membrane beta-barrel protein [Paludibacteraceae bacterium]
MTKRFFILLASLAVCIGIFARGNESDTIPYKFSTKWRLEFGYVQPYLRQHKEARSFVEYAGRIGFTVDFVLPIDYLTVQTGLYYSLGYDYTKQKFVYANEYLGHEVWMHDIMIPARLNLDFNVWRKLHLIFFAGPEFGIGLARTQYTQNHLMTDYGFDTQATLKQVMGEDFITDGKHDLYSEGHIRRFNFMLGVGGGIQWSHWQLLGGYDFGINKLGKKRQFDGLRQWQWYVSLAYQF